MSRAKIVIDRDELVRLGDSGMTIKQIAEYFGCSARVINKRRVEFGIKYGRGHSPANIAANHDPKRRDVANLPPIDPLEVREARFVQRLASDPRTKMFEYIGGYKSKEKKLTVRCRGCGELRETTPKSLFEGRRGSHVCFNCLRIERERAAYERRAAWEAHRAEELSKDKICKTCGRVYHSESDTSKYCSEKCRRKRKDKSHRKRARYYGVECDSSITWRSLSEHIGHCNCEICGDPCDPTDHSWNGHFGPLFPTVDCIVPMSKGGGYVWGNVQLAHAICNSAKRDLIDQDEILEAVIACDLDGERHEEGYEGAAAESPRAGDRGVHRQRRRDAQHGAACAAVPRDHQGDRRVGERCR